MSPPDQPPPTTPSSRPVRTQILSPADLSERHRDRMHALMSAHFDNVRRPQFDRDLAAKDWVVALFDPSEQIQGFTTLAQIEIDDPSAGALLAFYSGDTVLAPEYWGEHAWLGVWARHVFQSAERRPDRRAFWILLTATHRTYRFLPAFFREYYPRPDRPTPADWRRFLDAFVHRQFPTEYDPARGVVSLREPTPVRNPGQVQADVPADDPHAQFFVERNPGYLQSDFLACITEISRDNATPLGRRVLGNPVPQK